MSLYRYFRISKPSETKVPEGEVDAAFKRFRRSTFWGVTLVYSFYYVCRMALGVVKQPLIDSGLFTATGLGLMGSAFYIVYAFGKFINGFLADYCNIRRFMALGIGASAIINVILGVLGFVTKESSAVLTIIFSILWGLNGWLQSMGSPPGVIGLSRWYPLRSRGTVYSIFSSTPYAGRFLTLVFTGLITAAAGWQWGFIAAGIAGAVATVAALLLIHDTPESEGLPSLQVYYNEPLDKKEPTKVLQAGVLKHPGLWIIALSSAFLYITQHAVSDWGVLFLQKVKQFSLESATQVIGFGEVFGVVGTISAGFISDRIFRGNRSLPVLIAGLLSSAALAVFLFSGGGMIANILWISLFSMSIGIVFCIVAGLMALDFVPRRATGAAMGLVGISSYLAAGAQSLASGILIDRYVVDGVYNFGPACIFWTVSCLVAFILPIIGWKSFAGKRK